MLERGMSGIPCSACDLTPDKQHKMDGWMDLVIVQCWAGKRWVLVFMWMPLDKYHAPKHRSSPTSHPPSNGTPRS